MRKQWPGSSMSTEHQALASLRTSCIPHSRGLTFDLAFPRASKAVRGPWKSASPGVGPGTCRSPSWGRWSVEKMPSVSVGCSLLEIISLRPQNAVWEQLGQLRIPGGNSVWTQTGRRKGDLASCCLPLPEPFLASSLHGCGGRAATLAEQLRCLTLHSLCPFRLI